MAPTDSLASPDLYPVSFEPATELTRFLTLDEARYVDASFLDERLIDPGAAEDWRAWQEVDAATQTLAGECDFVFHISHVGSTLLSRLLGRSRSVHSLREPAVLRTLARSELTSGNRIETWATVFLRLWARVYRDEQKTLLKATSFTAELGPRLMRLQPGARAILMVARPAAHMAGILAGDASREELSVNSASRLARLQRRLGGTSLQYDTSRVGELAAMSWLSEVYALDDIASAFGDRTFWLEFDALLTNPAVTLAACLHHLHGRYKSEEIDSMMAGPDLRRYAKAPEFSYDPALRNRIVEQSFTDHHSEIEQGLAWLDGAASDHPVLADVMRRVARAIARS